MLPSEKPRDFGGATKVSIYSALGNPPVPSDYADRAVPRGAQFASDYYVQHLFWRSHLKETCSEVLTTDQNHPVNAITSLKNRCIDAAPLGGDPEACTACVEALEPLVPTCGTGYRTLGQSKCQALVGTPISSLDSSLTDPVSRWMNGNCIKASVAAMDYCTGTVPTNVLNPLHPGFPFHNPGLVYADPSDAIFMTQEGNPTYEQSACTADLNGPSLPLSARVQLPTSKFRIALMRTEGATTGVTPEWMMTAYDANSKFTEIALEPNADGSPECQGDYELSVQPVAAQSLGSLPAGSDLQRTGVFADGEYDLGFQFCGTTQRQTVWNRSCQDTIKYLNGLGVNFPQPKVAGTPSLAVDGYQYTEQSFPTPGNPTTTEYRCTLVEPRSPYSRKCAGGFQCNSADVCVPITNPPPNITYLSWW